jgi:ABC-type nitrate/sulfonate/bicarbonate transport system substrate-binding protein
VVIIRRRLLLAAGLALASMCTTSVALGQATKPSLTVGVGIDPSFATWVIAANKGFAAQHGIDLKIRTFEGGTPVLAALLAGGIDIANVGQATAPSIAPPPGSKPGAILTGITSVGDVFGIVASASVKTPQDLAKPGVVVGIPAGAAPYVLGRYLAHYKIDPKAVKTATVDPGSLVAALSKGDIHAFIAWDPHLSTATKLPGVRLLEYMGKNSIYTSKLTMMVSTGLAKQDDVLRNLMAALVESGNWLDDKKNRAEAHALLAKHFKMPEDAIAKFMTPYSFRVYFDAAAETEIKRISAWLIEVGRLKVEPVWTDFIDTKALKAAAPDRVNR